MFDIGANNGYYSMFCSRIAKNVFAFEPSKRDFARLSINKNLNKLDNNLKKLIIEKQGIQKNIDNIKKKLNDNSIYSFIQKESKNPEKIICLLSDKILEKESNGLEVIQNNLTKTILDISFNNMEFFDNIDNKISKQEQLNNYLDQLSSLNNAIEEIKQLKNKEEEKYLEFIIFLSKNILEINNIENQVSDLKKIILVLEDKIKNIEIEFSKNLTIMNNNLELDINKQKSTLKEQINQEIKQRPTKRRISSYPF